LVKKDEHVLVTGIGGGVALAALQFAVAVGAHVYVTSSSPEKIKSVVYHVWDGLNSKPIDQAIAMMSNGDQFGKLVIKTSNTSTGSPKL
jgi:NADPH-dependent curcumin reductase CurA